MKDPQIVAGVLIRPDEVRADGSVFSREAIAAALEDFKGRGFGVHLGPSGELRGVSIVRDPPAGCAFSMSTKP